MNIRIQKIAELVEKGSIAADIGTDHAYLPVLLVQNGTCEKVYACDIGEGPLKSAYETVHAADLQDRIPLILSNGFENVPEDADTAVIAGMGYYTAADILEHAMDRLPSMKRLIVEVNRNVEMMRRWISDHHFTITDEIVIEDRGFDYVAIAFNTDPHEAYTDEEILCGPVLMQKHTEDYIRFVEKKIRMIDEILSVSRKEERNASLRQEREVWSRQLG